VNSQAQRGENEVEISAVDRDMMARCIELAKIGAAAGELPFGSLVARQGQIIAEATNEIMRHVDESRHAEIVAIARARRLLRDDELSNCTLYSTVEPCPMCSFCIRTAGIRRVVYALGSPLMGGLSRWNIIGDDRFPLLFGPVPELVPGILADDVHKVWTDLKPAVGRAILLLGFLSKPKPKVIPRSRYGYSLRRLISMVLRQRKARSGMTRATQLEKCRVILGRGPRQEP
jgi:tRNA(adenine34) deaminase